jgi:hypothetical protein
MVNQAVDKGVDNINLPYSGFLQDDLTPKPPKQLFNEEIE